MGWCLMGIMQCDAPDDFVLFGVCEEHDVVFPVVCVHCVLHHCVT